MKSTSNVAPLLHSPGDKSSLKHDDHEKADILQNQFCSVFTNEPEGELPEFHQRADNIMTDIEITTEMVRNQIKKIDPNKAVGPDEIHPSMLIELVDYLAEPLAIIMNISLATSVLPVENGPCYTNIQKKSARNLSINY